jgi:hypothetical protein
MNGADGWEESLRTACMTLRALREELRKPSPGALASSGRRLMEAAENLRRFASAAADDADASARAEELHRELADVRGLLEQAAAYYLSWSKVLGAAAGGYGSDGRSPVVARSSMIVQG